MGDAALGELVAARFSCLWTSLYPCASCCAGGMRADGEDGVQGREWMGGGKGVRSPVLSVKQSLVGIDQAQSQFSHGWIDRADRHCAWLHRPCPARLVRKGNDKRALDTMHYCIR